MATAAPYTRYVCPCSDLTSASVANGTDVLGVPQKEEEDITETLNTSDPRANYSLYPLEHLLYCNECDAIRCPRCWTEEVINWYCPSCLFEVPSSAVKSDGNRCARNCYNCPCCTAPLAITAVNSTPQSDTHLKPTDAATHDTYILQCQYCEWTSLDADIQLSRPTKITEQLTRLRKSKSWKPPESGLQEPPTHGPGQTLSHDDAFSNLANFYKEQLSESRDGQNPYSGSPYGSPANLARIMSMYGGTAYGALKKTRQKPQPMREANSIADGFVSMSLDDEDDTDSLLERLQSSGWRGTASFEQCASAPVNNDAHFIDELWPVATALRTRRGKRCSTCRQFLTRPDPKVGSVRYSIRLLALNFIPGMTLRSIQPSQQSGNETFRLRLEEVTESRIPRLVPQQYVLTVRNPIWNSVKVTLATPAITPGNIASRVTILCPSFTVGPAGTVWEEALDGSTIALNDIDGGRQAAMASLTGKSEGDRQPEAGKIWDRTRNTTSVVLEVILPASEFPTSDNVSQPGRMAANVSSQQDVLEIPVYVRVDWEAQLEEPSSGVVKKPAEHRAASTKTDLKISKQLEYWCVLAVGRVAP